MSQDDHALPIACNLTAFSPEERQRHTDLSRQLERATVEVKELPNGYAFRYATDDATWMTAAEYVALERRCCPFLAFTLELKPDGEVSLTLTGDEGVKAFLSTQISQAT